MKICVTSKGNKLESDVDPRFGRCEYFVIVDTDTMEFEAFDNPSAMAMGGAGPQAAKMVHDRGAGAVVTGNVGPNASTTLEALKIRVYVGASGTVKQAVEDFKAGRLKEAKGPTTDSHSGM
ncbi:MAG: NifB/NifX family molybdenum-iron cluster-binding protein [Candidatus Margulisiibacteriota bacterium]